MAAMCIGVSLSLFLALRFAPAASSASAVSRRPAWMARCSGVWPSASGRFTGAPCLSSRVVEATLPSVAATCSGI